MGRFPTAHEPLAVPGLKAFGVFNVTDRDLPPEPAGLRPGNSHVLSLLFHDLERSVAVRGSLPPSLPARHAPGRSHG